MARSNIDTERDFALEAFRNVVYASYFEECFQTEEIHSSDDSLFNAFVTVFFTLTPIKFCNLMKFNYL